MLKSMRIGAQTVAWREYGKAEGEPVFFLHGWPGESHQGSLIHGAALQRGVRILAVNRPGIGGSSRQPGRGLLDWPPLLAAMADALGVERFRILGLSGGGPYALAAMWALGGRVIAGATVCGALPAAPGPGRRYLSPVYQMMLALHDRAPWLLQAALVPLVRVARVPPPRPLLWLGLRTLGPSDRAALWPRDRFPQYFPGFQNAMRSGMRGLWEDGKPFSSPWPFDPAEIRCPLTLWHGKQDRNFAIAGAAALAARIPGAHFRGTDDGHYSILANQAGPVLEALMG